VKPYAESCDINKHPILEVLQDLFIDRKHVLELASGTGQHAVHFARALPHLTWQTSELAENHTGIQAWLDEAQLPNVFSPVHIDANDEQWPVDHFDAIFNANTVHIMSWPEVVKLFSGIGRVLDQDGLLCLYGPFNYDRKFTSESNARFDVWLKSRNPLSGVRDFEALNALADAQGMTLLRDIEMPINNRTLVWQRTSS
jgi:SAM-dependent methyltransferase